MLVGLMQQTVNSVPKVGLLDTFLQVKQPKSYTQNSCSMLLLLTEATTKEKTNIWDDAIPCTIKDHQRKLDSCIKAHS